MANDVVVFDLSLSSDCSTEIMPMFSTVDHGGYSTNVTYSMVPWRKKLKIVLNYLDQNELKFVEEFLKKNLKNRVTFSDLKGFPDDHEYLILGETVNRTYEGSGVASVDFTVIQMSYK